MDVVGLLYWERREGREGTCVACLDWVEEVVLFMLYYELRYSTTFTTDTVLYGTRL